MEIKLDLKSDIFWPINMWAHLVRWISNIPWKEIDWTIFSIGGAVISAYALLITGICGLVAWSPGTSIPLFFVTWLLGWVFIKCIKVARNC